MLAPLTKTASAVTFALIVIIGSAGVPAGVSAGETPLTEVRQVRSLSPDEAARSHPVLLHGVVTYYHYLAEWNPLFVQDATGGIYVQSGAGDLGLHAGDEVEVEGVTGPGRFAPLVREPRIRRLGHGRLPQAALRTIDELLDGAWDSQFVEVEGVVRRVEKHATAGLFMLTLAGSRRTYRSVVRPSGTAAPPDLVDARVRVRGAAGTFFTQRRQIVGVQILTPGFENVEIVVPPRADPFHLPVRPASGLFQFDPKGGSGQRVRVRGTVTATEEDGALFIEDETGGLRIETDGPSDLRRGDVIEAVGFAEVGEYSPTLQAAQVRRVHGGPVPAARPVTVDEAMTGDYDSLPVQIEGVLADQAPLRSGASLLVKAGSQAFHVRVARSWPTGWNNGSLVRLRGICLVQPGPDNRVHSFRLAVGSADDVTMLGAGSWWTLRRALWAVVGLSGIVMIGLAWNVMLRRRVEQELARVRVLRGLLPICAWCKRIRDDRGYWSQVETYIHQHSSADFSHGICPECQVRELDRSRSAESPTPQ